MSGPEDFEVTGIRGLGYKSSDFWAKSLRYWCSNLNHFFELRFRRLVLRTQGLGFWILPFRLFASQGDASLGD